MSWEIVVLVALLGFLCVRNDYIQRVWLFVLAIIAWGSARLLMELNFVEGGYAWGSTKSVGVALSLFFCLLFTFLACYRPKRREQRTQGKGDLSPAPEKDVDDSADPNRRLRNILPRN